MYSTASNFQINPSGSRANLDQNVVHPDFEILNKEKVNGVIPVIKYRSRSTGLTIVHALISGPIVHGSIVVATKLEDNDGLANAVNQLIFLGSEDYPYPGVAEVCALKSFAQTSSWTRTDYTNYTIRAAGAEGFCQMLPIQMDHIFYPLLPETGFLTEIYNVNGQGQDSGEAYKQIEALENTGERKVDYELAKNVYPYSGYRFNPSGLMRNLRESTNIEKIRKYHKKYYNSKNVCVIICGLVDTRAIFRALGPIVQKIIRKEDIRKEWNSPWVDINEMPILKNSILKNITYPSNDADDQGLISIAFQGPSNLDQFEDIQALSLVLEYLTDGPISPLQAAFVENPDPIANSIKYSTTESTRSVFKFAFEPVSKSRVNEIQPLLRKILQDQANPDNFDRDRMCDMIRKYKRGPFKGHLGHPHGSIAKSVLSDFLFGDNDPKKFQDRLLLSESIEKFLKKESCYWIDLIVNNILTQSWVTVIAVPSVNDFKTLKSDDKTRVQNRVQKNGKDGNGTLKAFGDALDSAILANTKPIPESLLKNLRTPDSNKINFHKLVRYEDPDFAQCDCKVVFDDVQSNMIFVNVLMDTSAVQPEYRKYLPLFCEALTKSPVKLDDGTLMSYDKVINGLDSDLLTYSTTFGLNPSITFPRGEFCHILVLEFKFEMNKFQEGFDWIHKILWNIQWSADSLIYLANKMSSKINNFKTAGTQIATNLVTDLLYKEDSNVHSFGYFRQQKFLQDLSRTLAKKGSNARKTSKPKAACFCALRMKPKVGKNEKIEVYDILEEILNTCLKSNNMMVQIVASCDRLKEKGINLSSLLQSTFTFQTNDVVVKRIANQFDYYWMNEEQALFSSPKEIVFGGGDDFGHLRIFVPGLKNFEHPDMPVLAITLAYFSQYGGTYFKRIRGGKTNYGFRIDMRITEGLIFFKLVMSMDILSAYKAISDLFKSHLENDKVWDEGILESVKGTYICELVGEETTPIGLSKASLNAYFRNVSGDFSRELIEKVSKVQMDQVKDAFKNYLAYIFTKKNNCVMVCPKDKTKKYIAGFKDFDKKFKLLPSMDNCSLCKCPNFADTTPPNNNSGSISNINDLESSSTSGQAINQAGN